ncbi:MAG TPA: sulfur transferase domain-containing protein [Rhodanobacteraceae bacterium]|nr:sulfur transferase domain-containing protein [Rhodanobacteraceae bacterium]
MTKRWIRWAAVAVTAAAVGACHVGADPNAPRRLTDDVSVSGQITVASVKSLKEKGFRTIVNMRPDDESPDQAKYAQMQGAVQQADLGYGYMPVKATGSIPATSPKSLASILATMPKPVLVYAETPDRAAQVWALAEASRPGGLDAAAIVAALKSAGVKADDIASQIDARIAKRPKS